MSKKIDFRTASGAKYCFEDIPQYEFEHMVTAWRPQQRVSNESLQEDTCPSKFSGVGCGSVQTHRNTALFNVPFLQHIFDCRRLIKSSSTVKINRAQQLDRFSICCTSEKRQMFFVIGCFSWFWQFFYSNKKLFFNSIKFLTTKFLASFQSACFA